ncbi:alpha/beta-hydrolase [Lactarius pseudohatsudake]|nr:alpha/beta-hydrolase [Lactarius pseudohatsudake]
MKTTTLFVFLLHALVAAAQPNSQPIVVSPAHQYNCDSTTPVSFHPIPSLPDTLVPSWTLRAVPTTVFRRPRSQESLKHPAWEPVEVLGPDVQDKHTLSQLARISGNAYALPGQKNWYDVDSAWNNSFPFGWEDSTEGFRGHVFLSPDNGTAILSIKGTTVQGPTSKKDKFNDNLLFSCCCARIDFSWIFSTVCDCFSGHWTCDDTCLTQALIEDSLFYSVGMNLVKNLTLQYPDANVWLVGHSLGGALASLLGTTFGFPVVAFESPGERLAARRLHLPLPPLSNTSGLPVTPVTHVYHNADPIPQGACTGFRSACASAGYALETRCHLGKSIVYDTVGELGWRVSVQSHPIKEVILRVIEGDQQWEDGRNVPLAVEEVDCIVRSLGDFRMTCAS